MRLGPWEIALIAMFVVVLFGARKIPEIMRGLGSGVREFKEGLHEGEEGDSKSEDSGNPKPETETKA